MLTEMYDTDAVLRETAVTVPCLLTRINLQFNLLLHQCWCSSTRA